MADKIVPGSGPWQEEYAIVTSGDLTEGISITITQNPPNESSYSLDFVTITAEFVDPTGSGLKHMWYSLTDGVSWQKYIEPFTVYDNGNVLVAAESNSGATVTAEHVVYNIKTPTPVISVGSKKTLKLDSNVYGVRFVDIKSGGIFDGRELNINEGNVTMTLSSNAKLSVSDLLESPQGSRPTATMSNYSTLNVFEGGDIVGLEKLTAKTRCNIEVSGNIVGNAYAATINVGQGGMVKVGGGIDLMTGKNAFSLAKGAVMTVEASMVGVCTFKLANGAIDQMTTATINNTLGFGELSNLLSIGKHGWLQAGNVVVNPLGRLDVQVGVNAIIETGDVNSLGSLKTKAGASYKKSGIKVQGYTSVDMEDVTGTDLSDVVTFSNYSSVKLDSMDLLGGKNTFQIASKGVEVKVAGKLAGLSVFKMAAGKNDQSMSLLSATGSLGFNQADSKLSVGKFAVLSAGGIEMTERAMLAIDLGANSAVSVTGISRGITSLKVANGVSYKAAAGSKMQGCTIAEFGETYGTDQADTIAIGNYDQVKFKSLDLGDGVNKVTIGGRCSTMTVDGDFKGVSAISIAAGKNEIVNSKLFVKGTITFSSQSVNLVLDKFATLSAGSIDTAYAGPISISTKANSSLILSGTINNLYSLSIGAGTRFKTADGGKQQGTTIAVMQNVFGTLGNDKITQAAYTDVTFGNIDLLDGVNTINVAAGNAKFTATGSVAGVSSFTIANAKNEFDIGSVNITGKLVFNQPDSTLTIGKYDEFNVSGGIVASNIGGVSIKAQANSDITVGGGIKGLATLDIVSGVSSKTKGIGITKFNLSGKIVGTDLSSSSIKIADSCLVKLDDIDLGIGVNSISVTGKSSTVTAGKVKNISSLSIAAGYSASLYTTMKLDSLVMNAPSSSIKVGKFAELEINDGVSVIGESCRIAISSEANSAIVISGDVTGVGSLKVTGGATYVDASGFKTMGSGVFKSGKIIGTQSGDTLSFGNYSEVEMNGVDLGAGSNKITIGKYCNVSAGDVVGSITLGLGDLSSLSLGSKTDISGKLTGSSGDNELELGAGGYILNIDLGSGYDVVNLTGFEVDSGTYRVSDSVKNVNEWQICGAMVGFDEETTLEDGRKAKLVASGDKAVSVDLVISGEKKSALVPDLFAV
ncbi:MAG: hypothetical protein MJ025_04785 [Victivallaceae bacterium]|nr:hypothetical protein [Victivallaceae bacterium]